MQQMKVEVNNSSKRIMGRNNKTESRKTSRSQTDSIRQFYSGFKVPTPVKGRSTPLDWRFLRKSSQRLWVRKVSVDNDNEVAVHAPFRARLRRCDRCREQSRARKNVHLAGEKRPRAL